MNVSKCRDDNTKDRQDARPEAVIRSLGLARIIRRSMLLSKGACLSKGASEGNGNHTFAVLLEVF